MASAEDYANWIVANKHKKGTPEFAKVQEAYQVAKDTPVEPESSRLPAAAGMMDFAATAGGTLIDTAERIANLGIAGFGSAATALGKPDLAPALIKGTPGGSESFRDSFRRLSKMTGIDSLNPDNPTPNSEEGKRQYDFAARGGMIPGAAIPAAFSMIAEHYGGPEWAGVGSMTPAAISRVASQMPRPTPSPQVALLNREGVTMTPGEQLGGAFKRAEDAATSWPLLGDTIKAAQRRNLLSFNEAAINRSLAPIGEELPKGMKGNEAIRYAREKLWDKYDSLLPNLKGDLHATTPGTAVAVPGTRNPQALGATGTGQGSLQQELDNIRQMGQNLPEPQRGQLNRILDHEVIERFTPAGLASGETLKNIESKLGELRNHYKVGDYDARTLSGAIAETQAALRRMIERVNPSYAGELAQINEGYANFKKVQQAGANIGAKDGVFMPAQLQRAVRNQDTTKDKRAFSEGDALLQDLSSAGKNVLSPTVPDSGTPLRHAIALMLAHPVKAAFLGLPLGAAGAAAYSPFVQNKIQGILQSQPPNSILPAAWTDLAPGILSQGNQ